MSPFAALVARDMRLAFRAGGGASLAAAFFALVSALVPFGVGPDLVLLGRIAGGMLWVAAALAALLSLDRLFQVDYEDGSLDVLALSPLPLESAAAAKILAHWLTTGLPLTVLSPVLGLLLNLPAPGYGALVLSLAIGTPALSAVGAIGAALTLSIRRGGLILALIVLPLIAPTLIFGAGAVEGAIDATGNGAFFFSCGILGSRDGVVAFRRGSLGAAQSRELNGGFDNPLMKAYVNVMRITALANPKRFLDFSNALLPWTGALAFLLLAVGLYWALFATPPDYQQGQSVKIMFVHVPAAYMGIMVYAVMAAASLTGLVFRHPLADVAAKSAAPIGAAFTALALVTGSLWGRPMWGTYWQWGDARLVSELILFFIYLGYIALWNAIDDPQRAAKAAAILSLVGAADVPIIHFSVDWWNTLHQPASIIRLGGPTIDKAFLWPLFVMMLAYTVLFVWLWLLRMQAEIFERRARALMLAKGA